MPEYELHFQLHYMRRQGQRKFTDEQCKKVINSPDLKVAQGHGFRGGTVFRMQKDVGGKILVVVAELLKNHAYLITAFFKDE